MSESSNSVAPLGPRSVESLEVLEERARLLAQPLRGTDESAVVDVIVFRSGGQAVAFHTQSVREVAQYRPAVPLPNAPAFILGVINLHGEILPLLDLPNLIGARATDDSREIVVLHLGAGVDCAVPADSDGYCVSASRDAIEPPERLGRHDLPAWVVGLLRVDGEVATLIDPQKLLQEEPRILAFRKHSTHSREA